MWANRFSSEQFYFIISKKNLLHNLSGKKNEKKNNKTKTFITEDMPNHFR